MIPASLKNKIVWSTVAQLLAKVVQIVLGVVAIRMVTAALGPDEFGLYGKISEYALFFSVAANLGIFGNTVRKMSEAPHDGRLFVNALLLRMATASLFFVLGAVLAWVWNHDWNFVMGILFFMGSLFFDYVTSVCDATLQANYKMGRASAALVAGRLSNLMIIFLLVNVDIPHLAPFYFLGPLASSVVTAGLSILFVRQIIKFHWELDIALLRMLFLTGLPFGIINILNNLYFRFLPSYFAAHTLSDAQFGSYNICLHIASTASLLSTLIMFSSLPALKQAIEKKETQRVRELLKILKKSLFILALVMVIGGSFIAPYAIEILSGKVFIIAELWFILPLLMVLAAVSYFYDLVLITLFAFEEDLWLIKREGFALLVGVCLLFSSLLLDNPIHQMFMILIAAIAAEGTTTYLGLKKIRERV